MKRRRLEETLNSKDAAQSNWETRRFNLMKPGKDGCLREFHARLVAQAEKCGFECSKHCQDRMVRDRLIMFMDSDQCRFILSRNHNPTSEDILREEEKDKAWPHILPYLTLPDLRRFAKSHPKFRNIRNAHLKSGHALIMDKYTLTKYPVESNKDTYLHYGLLATHIEFRGLLGYEMESLFPLFPNITQLTLRKVQVANKDSKTNYPRSLRQLNIIDSSLFRLGEWLGQIRGLKVLHLKSVGSCLRNLNQLKKLRSLSILNNKVSLEDFSLPVLEDLTISCWSNQTYECVRELCGSGTLKSLRVLGSVYACQLEKIEALSLNSVDIKHVIQPPEEPNLILRLNDDCMLHLRRFLPDTDWIALKDLHPQWKQLSIRYFKLSSDYVKTVPAKDREHFYRQNGALVLSLSVWHTVPVEELGLAIPHFTNLTELEMHLDTKTSKILHKVDLRGLVSLKLSFSIKSINWRRLFRPLNATLRKLSLFYCFDVNHEYVGLSELNHIQHLTINNVRHQEDFLRFLRLNQGSLRSMEIGGLQVDDSITADSWSVISQMPNLKSLSVISVRPASIPKGSLPGLQDLYMEDVPGVGAVEEFLLSLEGSKLQRLCFYASESDKTKKFSYEVWIKMRNLKVLRLGYYKIDIPKNLTILTKLRELQVSVEKDKALKMILRLPQLEEIELLDKPTPELMIKIRKYMRYFKRSLIVNYLQL